MQSMASIRRHQMLAFLPPLSLSVFPLSFCHRIYPIILAVVHQSASQSYESFSFTFRFRFQSICLAFLAVPPSLIQPLRRPPAAIDLRVGCFRNASCLPLFFVVLGLLYRFCAPFSKQQENTAGQTLPSNRVACCIFKYGLK